MSDLEAARRIADAVLYEGYPLSLHRAGAVKNQTRRRSGVLVPPGFTVTGEPSACRTECLLDGGEVVRTRSRFLHVQTRTSAEGETFDEAAEREIDHVWRLEELLAGERVREVRVSGGEETTGGVTRIWQPLDVRVGAAAERLPGPYGTIRLRLWLENAGTWTGEDRPEALRHSLVAAHTLLALTGGRFVSLADPPEWARPAAESCENLRTWPVLIEDDLVLSSPIVLADRPQIAPEGPGDLDDATEIDEIRSPRTTTPADEEKREARATGPRAARIVGRVDAMPPEPLERLHGAIRSPGPRRGRDTGPDEVPVFGTETPWWDPGADASVSPETDLVTIAGREVGRGSKVRLRPAGRADAQDMFVAGRVATVEAVLSDVDGCPHLAVTIDDDPGTDLRRAQGRYWYFAPGDVEPLRKILVAGVGNVFLGDDGFGVEVARRLAEAELPEGVDVGDFGIRGIHLVYELSSYDTTILVDAAPRGAEPGTLYALELEEGAPRAAVDAHGMTPEAVLDLVGVVGGEVRRVLLVGCEPADVEPGMELSPPVAAAIEPAVRLVRELIEEELRDHQTTESRDGAVS